MTDVEKIRGDLQLAINNNSYNQLKFVAELAHEKLGELQKAIIERDVAVAEIKEILETVEKIRIKVREMLPTETDDALVGLCLHHCANAGENCFKEGDSSEICANWKWRGSRQCPECADFMICEPPKQEQLALAKGFCPIFKPKTISKGKIKK